MVCLLRTLGFFWNRQRIVQEGRLQRPSHPPVEASSGKISGKVYHGHILLSSCVIWSALSCLQCDFWIFSVFIISLAGQLVCVSAVEWDVTGLRSLQAAHTARRAVLRICWSNMADGSTCWTRGDSADADQSIRKSISSECFGLCFVPQPTLNQQQ